MTPQELAPVAIPLRELGIEALDLENAFFTCVGAHLHTTATVPRDCKLYHNPDGSWRFHCQHTSCKQETAAASWKLTVAVLGADGAARAAQAAKLPASTSTPTAMSTTPTSLTHGSHTTDKDLLAAIIAEHSWPYSEIISASDEAIGEPASEHHLQLLGLFDDNDIVWIGRDVYDTGSPNHSYRFRPVQEWLAHVAAPGSYICPSTFRPGIYSRKAANVAKPKFLVVESDKLTRDEIGAVFRWLDAAVDLRLRAVVDTAGKSLHGWFDYPNARVLRQLGKWLPRLGCDPAMFNPAQPCRLAGAKRGDGYQRLIFIPKTKQPL